MVLPFLVLENEVSAVDDLIIGDMGKLVGMFARKLGNRSDEQTERGNALLAVDDEEFVHPTGTELPTQNHDHGTGEVIPGAPATGGHDVIPELPALLLVPRVRALVDGDDHPLVGGGEQADDCLWRGVHVGSGEDKVAGWFILSQCP